MKKVNLYMLSTVVMILTVGFCYGAGVTVRNDHHDLVEAIEMKDWQVAAEIANNLCQEEADNEIASDTYFYLGVANYHLQHYEFANKNFTTYMLRPEENKEFIDLVIEYKFSIAEKITGSEKTHLYGIKQLPRLQNGYELGLKIYSEVITMEPWGEYAAKSYLAMGGVYKEMSNFPKALEQYQSLIRLFPRHECGARAYLGISEIYREKMRGKYLDTHLLELVRQNAEEFAKSYPRDPLLKEVRKQLITIEDMFAKDLFSSSEYFYKKNKLEASALYCRDILRKYPDTETAEKARQHLADIKLNRTSINQEASEQMSIAVES